MPDTFNGRTAVGWALAGAGAIMLGRKLLRDHRRFSFRGSSVFITGGSRGLGLILARQLVGLGASVAISARNQDELNRACSDIRSHGNQADVLGVVCDVTDSASVSEAVTSVRERFGEIDVLINNAGVIVVAPEQEMSDEDYREALGVHFWGPLHTTRAVVDSMRRRGAGRIINVASIGGKLAVPHLVPYSASKAALIALSDGLRAELMPHGIYVTTVCPGLMRTGSHLNAQFKGNQKAECGWFTASATLPLISMDAQRAADQILRACSEGRAHVVLSLPAKLASLIHGIAPSMTADALALANRALPASDGGPTERAPGYKSRPRLLPKFLTRLGDKAAAQNNELPQSAFISNSESSS